MDPSKITIPPMMDLTDSNITSNVNIINSQSPNKRLQYLITTLVTHLHDFARETRLTSEEWMAAIQFLTAVGQKCDDIRQEFILLSDTLGLSVLVDGMNHPKPPGATEGTVLGPFHTHDAHRFEIGEDICSPGKGEPMLVLCTVKDTAGKPLEGVTVDVWETDDTGHYDTQYPGRTTPDCRGVLESNDEGFWFKCVKPVPYPIPSDGPVGKMLSALHRHCYRPAHLHFKFKKAGYDELVTALYPRGDPYETSDAVFGVKSSLIVDIETISDSTMAEKYSMKVGDHLLKWNFVLTTDTESEELKNRLAKQALETLGSTAKLENGVPVASE
ncbi:hypothetical protein TWF569_010868 [Orbilia oligospora]|uniref:Intradiol ring-cleavage dioxygenases domain-containing protein n=1 Tax=Orbilia oligospora TaxID=2813651 RepID=A0A7C8J9B1_ORBOL|nr:hypothetical protein TWF103_001447 [Orbilia oligospora]KAF3087206.1 hypothetical protein TWF103_001447 [Orbilia oligospora]KAF3091553.1 hypothetical protein TWF706_009528 [Orbilia oligospora]KAF3098182.1 hypothetical protein TWF102_006170 [Orbilia oligospora]KAF3132586.1 hypothetical protein TWF569_010868 [Orbilia oligospora]